MNPLVSDVGGCWWLLRSLCASSPPSADASRLGILQTPFRRSRGGMNVLLKLAAAVMLLTAVVVIVGENTTHAAVASYTLESLEVERSLLLFIGDSLTERGESSDQDGWITRMRHDYIGSVDILTRAYPGYNSRWGVEYVLPLIERDLDKLPAPALITLWYGTNDATLTDGAAAGTHVPVDEYSVNLVEIVERLQAKAPAANIVLITPPPVDEDRLQSADSGRLDRSNEQAGVYALACVQAAQAANVTVLDLYSLLDEMETDERNACLVDGVHLSAKGNKVMQQQLMATIEHAFPELATALKTPQLPGWRDLGDMGNAVVATR